MREGGGGQISFARNQPYTAFHMVFYVSVVRSICKVNEMEFDDMGQRKSVCQILVDSLYYIYCFSRHLLFPPLQSCPIFTHVGSYLEDVVGSC